jgi:ABC-type transport system involved in multi-copper enzyme maturation permease subunit
VNLTLMSAFWRERFTSPVRLLLLFMFWSTSLLISFVRRPVTLPADDWTIWLTLILGAGVIGRDLSTGVLQLIFARPIQRWEYVISRWFALGTAVFGLALLAWLITVPFALAGGTKIGAALVRLVESYFIAYGLGAVITGFSALLSGFGDLALWLVAGMFSMGLGMLGAFARQGWALTLSSELLFTLVPNFDFDRGFYYNLVSWASTITVFLLLGVFAMNRRELSYATAG